VLCVEVWDCRLIRHVVVGVVRAGGWYVMVVVCPDLYAGVISYERAEGWWWDGVDRGVGV